MLIEAALVLISFVLMTVGVMDWGKCLWAYTTVSRATTLAARCAAVSDGLTDANFISKCGSTLANYQTFGNDSALPLKNITFNVTPVSDCVTQSPGATNNAILVTAQFTYNFTIVPYPLGPYTETACFWKQQ